MDLCSPKNIKYIMEKYRISPKKGLGQNFLTNPLVPERTALEASGGGACRVLEIGPGIGCLTVCLGNCFDEVICVEIDADLIPVLNETLSDYENIKVINADIMKADINGILGGDEKKTAVCANLPYYITTPVIMMLLECGYPFESLTFLVQKEVADRLCAKPGSGEYGAVTAAVSYYGEAKKLFNVPAGGFTPVPKVDSAVIKISLYEDKPVKPLDEKTLFKVIKGAFGQRRKTLVNALCAAFCDFTKEEVREIVTGCGFDENIRGEKLSVADFCAIADAIADAIAKRKT